MDITRGSDKIEISLVYEVGIELPKSVYIPQNTSYQDAYVPFSLARISCACSRPVLLFLIMFCGSTTFRRVLVFQLKMQYITLIPYLVSPNYCPIHVKAHEAHTEMLACKGVVPIVYVDTMKADVVRKEPFFSDNNGHVCWRLNGCSDKPGILLQDIGNADHTVSVVDKWFEYDAEQVDLIEKHINVLSGICAQLFKFEFHMSPSAISPVERKGKSKNIDDSSRSIAERLRTRGDNDIVLLPYNPGFDLINYQISPPYYKSLGVSRTRHENINVLLS